MTFPAYLQSQGLGLSTVVLYDRVRRRWERELAQQVQRDPPKRGKAPKTKPDAPLTWLQALPLLSMPARTVATYRAAVFHWLDFQKIPFDRSSAIRVSRGRSKQRTYRHALSPGELILYDQAIDKSDIPDPYWTILRLLPWSGLRIAEACTLKGDAITTHGAISGLLVVGKGNKSRFVPLPKHGRELLKAWIKIRDRSSDWLFPRGRGRKGLDRPALPDTARLYLRELRGATKGLPANLTPHVLRHCYATTILNRGGNLRELQDLMGHASISTTAIYTAPSVERLASVVDLLEDE